MAFRTVPADIVFDVAETSRLLHQLCLRVRAGFWIDVFFPQCLQESVFFLVSVCHVIPPGVRAVRSSRFPSRRSSVSRSRATAPRLRSAGRRLAAGPAAPSVPVATWLASAAAFQIALTPHRCAPIIQLPGRRNTRVVPRAQERLAAAWLESIGRVFHLSSPSHDAFFFAATCRKSWDTIDTRDG